jgi:arylsulfatase A-like enzyme
VSKEIATAMDFHPTLAALTGHNLATLPEHDGKNLLPLWRGEPNAKSGHEYFFYYLRNELQAVRDAQWKLRHDIDKKGSAKTELFDLTNDPGETTDLAAQYPDVVKRLSAAMDDMRQKLGDARLRIPGTERRPPAITADPKPLTTFDPAYPYIEPAYLLHEAG